jgi:hypothetical protein
MLERVKQYGMAAQKRQEADQKLADAVSIDSQERSNFQRQIKAITATGSTLLEIIDAVCTRIGKWSPDIRVTIREIARRNYIELYNMTIWREAQMLRLVSCTGGQVVTLPSEYDSVISVREDSQVFQMLNADTNYFFALDPTMLDVANSGTPTHFVMLAPVATALQPGTDFTGMTRIGGPMPPQFEAEQIRFVSSDDSDSGEVFLRGESTATATGITTSYEESVKLQGNTPVYSTYRYDTLLVVGKGMTGGWLNIVGNDSGRVLDTYKPDEKSKSYPRFQLVRNKGVDLNVLVHGKRKVEPLVHDHDKPMISGAANAIIFMTCAEIMSMDSDTAPMAATFTAKAEKAVSEMMDRELNQSASKTRIVPIVDGYNYGRGDF